MKAKIVRFVYIITLCLTFILLKKTKFYIKNQLLINGWTTKNKTENCTRKLIR